MRQAWNRGGAHRKLTDHDVYRIRRRLYAGELQRSIAAEYGITRAYVSRIKRGLVRASYALAAILTASVLIWPIDARAAGDRLMIVTLRHLPERYVPCENHGDAIACARMQGAMCEITVGGAYRELGVPERRYVRVHEWIHCDAWAHGLDHPGHAPGLDLTRAGQR